MISGISRSSSSGIPCLVVALATLAGCDGSSSNLNLPERLTLYSIDGDEPDLDSIDGGSDLESGEASSSEETFHGYPVLGKVEIDDAKKRGEIMAALRQGMARNDIDPADCFWPHHGIRAVEQGQTVDYVICFKCLQLHVYRDGKMTTELTSDEPQSVFDKHLQQAGIPFAPASKVH